MAQPAIPLNSLRGVERAVPMDIGPTCNLSPSCEAIAPHLRRPRLFVLKSSTYPGMRADNSLAEVLNSRFRLECLNEHWRFTLDDARGKINTW